MFLPFSPIELVEQICVCSTHQKSYFCINLQVSPRPGKCNILKSKTYTRLYVVKTIQIQSCMQKRKKNDPHCRHCQPMILAPAVWLPKILGEAPSEQCKIAEVSLSGPLQQVLQRSCGIIFSEHLNMHFVCSFRHVSRKQTKIEFSLQSIWIATSTCKLCCWSSRCFCYWYMFLDPNPRICTVDFSTFSNWNCCASFAAMAVVMIANWIFNFAIKCSHKIVQWLCLSKRWQTWKTNAIRYTHPQSYELFNFGLATTENIPYTCSNTESKNATFAWDTTASGYEQILHLICDMAWVIQDANGTCCNSRQLETPRLAVCYHSTAKVTWNLYEKKS